jgi:hypothetical protein
MRKQKTIVLYNEYGLRRCTKCLQYKELYDFHKFAKSTDGLKSMCKTCVKSYDKEENLTKLALPPKVVGEMIHCRWCKEYLFESSFGKGKTYCKSCSSKIGHTNNIKRFGLTPEQYIDISNAQDNVCKICGSEDGSGKRLSVDHDHSCCFGPSSCGKCIRGLLCSRCNKTLGMVNDDASMLNKMVAYLSS